MISGPITIAIAIVLGVLAGLWLAERLVLKALGWIIDRLEARADRRADELATRD